MLSEELRAMATGNMCNNFGEVRPRGFRVMHVDRQTGTQTNSSQYFATLMEQNNK